MHDGVPCCYSRFLLIAVKCNLSSAVLISTYVAFRLNMTPLKQAIAWTPKKTTTALYDQPEKNQAAQKLGRLDKYDKLEFALLDHLDNRLRNV